MTTPAKSPLGPIRNRILTEAERQGLSLRQLAIAAGITHSAMYRFRDGEAVNTTTLESLMLAVGIVGRPVKAENYKAVRTTVGYVPPRS